MQIPRYPQLEISISTSLQVYGTTLDGKGQVQYRNGNRYEGEFNNGLLHGKQFISDFNYNESQGMEHFIGRMILNTQELSSIIASQDQAVMIGQMDLGMRERSRTGFEMGMASLPHQTKTVYMRENGKTD